MTVVIFKKWYRRPLAIIIFLLLIFILAAAVVFSLQVIKYIRQIEREKSISIGSKGAVKQDNFFNQKVAGPRSLIETGDDPSLGPSAAPVTIVEFADFQCPFCRRSYPIIRELETLYKGKIRFIYRDFPILQIHPDAMLAHIAANCAADQGKFWVMHDRIFQNQENIKEDDLKKYALRSGLDMPEFDSCLKSDKHNQEIIGDFNDGLSLGVKGTPTWFINGRKLEGIISLERWKDLVTQALNQ